MLQENIYNIQKLDKKEKEELKYLLAIQNPRITDDLEQIWYLMDKIWDKIGCDNKKPNWEKIRAFYSHPVWLLNGLFIENHQLSMEIRDNLADYIVKQAFSKICDYGGGFGTLARTIAKKDPNMIIHIYEPHPSQYGLECVKNYPNISFVTSLKKNDYDCIISTDVLEHVDSPMQTLQEMSVCIKGGGAMIIANCFYPYIKCHLPQNFHFRYTFDFFAKSMGIKKIEKIPNTHAVFYKKIKQHTSLPSKYMFWLSRILFHVLECLKKIRKITRRKR